MKIRNKILPLTIMDRRLPKGKPTGHNEKYMLECPWIGESTGKMETSILVKAA